MGTDSPPSCHSGKEARSLRSPRPPRDERRGRTTTDRRRTTASSIEYIRAGKLRPLAVTTATGIAVLPGIPALAEFLPTYEASIFVGIVAPRNTSTEIISKLNAEINLAHTDSKITRRIAELGNTPLSLSSSEFAKLITDETEKWGRVHLDHRGRNSWRWILRA
jgi:tripartite-type tricarboxylate transporter receptor subunit TctC